MKVYHLPVAYWEDHGGLFTAYAVESGEAAYGATLEDAVGQIERYLRWRARRGEGPERPELTEGRVTLVPVTVQPGYPRGLRTMPTLETVRLTVPCVHGPLASGLSLACLPTFEASFYYHDARHLPALVRQQVQSRLQGETPQFIAGCLPPKSVGLRFVRVALPDARRSTDRDWRSPVLEQVAEAVRELKGQYARAYGREAQVDELVRRLQVERTSVLLVGETGSGKTSLLVQAVGHLEKSAPEDEQLGRLPKERFFLTSASRLIAGMRYLGQWEERCEEIVAALGRRKGVLCVESLVELLRLGGVGPEDSIGAFLAPYLAENELQMVAEATPAELDACRRLLPGFADHFAVVHVPTFDRPQSQAVLRRVATGLESRFGVQIDEAVPEHVYRLFARFAPYGAFPGEATGFMRDLAEQAGAGASRAVDAPLVVERFIRRTGLPERLIRDEHTLEPQEVRAALARQVIGQDEACRAAGEVVMAFKAGLNDPDRPVGVLLFAGPTGVGKTELARTLARYLFGHGAEKDRLIRLDMSEYAGPGAPARLLGDGGAPSDFLQRVRRQPFVVVLFDEIEKAAPQVFDLLLGLFDEGRISDEFGRVTTFRSAVLVLTTNLGADRRGALGFHDGPPANYEAEIRAFFRPELYNRIDRIVAFAPLDRASILAITAKELDEIGRREGLAARGILLRWSAEALAHLAERAFDAELGARPLQRTLEELVVAPLARLLVANPQPDFAALDLELDRAGQLRITPRNA